MAETLMNLVASDSDIFIRQQHLGGTQRFIASFYRRRFPLAVPPAVSGHYLDSDARI
jgi:hypothetical protein